MDSTTTKDTRCEYVQDTTERRGRGTKLHPYKMEEKNCDTIVQTLVWKETKEQTHADTYRNDIKNAKERESPTPNMLSNDGQCGEVCSQ